MKMRGSDAGNPRNKTKTDAAVEEDKVLTLPSPGIPGAVAIKRWGHIAFPS